MVVRSILCSAGYRSLDISGWRQDNRWRPPFDPRCPMLLSMLAIFLLAFLVASCDPKKPVPVAPAPGPIGQAIAPSWRHAAVLVFALPVPAMAIEVEPC